MTLGGFIVRNTFRNKRRSLLTMVSIGFSLLLLTLMISVWHTVFIDVGSRDTAKRVITRDHVSLSFPLPAYYRDKIRSVPGVTAVVPLSWFGGRYKDDRTENFFAQFATDPDEYLKVASDKIVPPDQAAAWQRDRAGALVDISLVNKYGWKIGDHVHLQGTIFPADLDLTIRAIYRREPRPQDSLYFNAKYLEESVDSFKGTAGWFAAEVTSPGDVARVSREIDDMFRNSPHATKTESEKAFQLSFVAMLGNVKAFILGICGAVVFAISLVSANTMAMSIRSRIREVGLLKTLGFTRRGILKLFVFEAVALAVAGGFVGIVAAAILIRLLTLSQFAIGIPADMNVKLSTVALALLVAAGVGLISGYIPAYSASRKNIVESLRHIG
jgi:putative ABC transport system permease protein